MAKSTIRRVVGAPELLSFGGSWLTKRGKRFTGLATIIAGGTVVADIIGDNLFGYQIPVSKLDMAMVPTVAAGVTFGLGGVMNYAAKLMSGADRAAAEANSVCEVREMKQTPEETRKQAEALWDRVAQYESVLVNGDGSSEKERDRISATRGRLTSAIGSLPDGDLERLGVDLANRKDGVASLVYSVEISNPLSSGLESSREGFVESAVFALNEAMPHMEQKARTGFDLSQVEFYRNWEIFESNLSNIYKSNRFLQGARKKANLPMGVGIESAIKGFGDGVLKNLTRNKMYMMAGKGMNALNSGLDGNSFDAQPFIWMTGQLEKQIRGYGDDAINRVVQDRANIRSQIFGDDAGVRGHIYDCFDADYLKALRLRLGFDVEYAAGVLDQKPKDDIGKMSDLVGKKILSDKVLSKYEEVAKRSLDESSGLTSGFNEVASRAIKIGHYTGGRATKVDGFIYGVAKKAGEFSDELVQTRIHDYLAKEQIEFHCGLVEKLGDSKV